MKVIDILNKISKNELPDKTRFKVYSSTEDKSFICEYDMNYPGVIWRICDERCRFNYKIDFMRILNYEVEVIEENKEIEEKLDWEEIIGSVGKPVWDNKRKKWRVLDYYCREKDIFYVSFSDTSNREKFEEKELYFKEREEK